jgi:hypothetical protein
MYTIWELIQPPGHASSAVMLSTIIVYYVIKYCVLKVALVVFVMFCIDDNPLFGFLDIFTI